MADDRFENLKKIPPGPAARLLADANLKLDTELDAPVSAPASEVLKELEEKGALVDMLKLISAALPPRECVWWACLAAHDVPAKETSPILKAAEKWVFQPTKENREALQAVIQLAGPDDDQALCGTAAFYGDGTLGTGDLETEPAPVGVVAAMSLGQNFLCLKDRDDDQEHMRVLIDRGLDIARGGNGRLDGAPGEGVAEG
ncbi:MAG: hypothetical protein AAGG09_22715 [Pseudomonadota bacterium]